MSLDHQRYETIDNARNENELFKRFSLSQSEAHRTKLSIVRWTLVISTAILISFISILVRIYRMYLISSIFKPKLLQLITANFPENPTLTLATWIALSVLLMAIASGLVVFVAPQAGGNDIAAVIAFSNGVLIKNQFTLRTGLTVFASMMVHIPMSTICTEVAPMLKLGATLGYLLPNMLKSTELVFLGEQDERRMLAFCGMSAGLAASVDAPIAGTLLAIEHTTNNYSKEGIAFIFASSCIAKLVTHITMHSFVPILLHKDSMDARRDNFYGDINDEDTVYWSLEFLIYALIGTLGGALGTLWTCLSLLVYELHDRYCQTNKAYLLLEALVYAAIVAAFQISLLYFIRDSCLSLDSIKPEYRQNLTFPEKFFVMPSIHCVNNSIPEAGIVLISPHHIIIFMLYAKSMAFSMLFLVVLFAGLYILSLFCVSLRVATGVFISQIIIGSLWGRLLGEIINSFVKEPWSDPTKFALLGAAAQVTGVFHYSLVTVAVLVETTGSYQAYSVPLLMTTVTARCIAYFLSNRSYYQKIFIYQDIPFLSPTIPWANVTPITKIMKQPIISLSRSEKVRRIMEVLELNKGKYPIISSKNFLLGDISRTYLCAMLLHNIHNFKQPLRREDFLPVFYALCRVDGTIEYYEKAMRTLRNTLKDPEDYDKVISLQPFMNQNFIEVTAESNMASVYTIFRQTGVHTLYIVQAGRVIGVVTRKDIIDNKGFMKKLRKEKT